MYVLLDLGIRLVVQNIEVIISSSFWSWKNDIIDLELVFKVNFQQCRQKQDGVMEKQLLISTVYILCGESSSVNDSL